MTAHRSFLVELVEKLLEEFSGNLEGLSVIFPNRRAGLFFTRALSERIDNPIWSPSIVSLEDFIYEISSKRPSDNLSLLLDLYEIFTDKTGFKETFDRFYFWGEMLLRDFNEIDKNLIRAETLFTTLRNLKEIDIQFDFMSPEEKEAIKRFWGNALQQETNHKGSFIQFWQTLYPVYTTFRKQLETSGMAYSGMIYKRLSTDIWRSNFKWEKGKVIFAGFNALLPSEERIIKWFVESSNANIYWDLDQYYFKNKTHEAGFFLRQYYQDKVFRPTFSNKHTENFYKGKKQIHTIASSQYSGQARIAGNIIQQLLWKQGADRMQNTVVVFPDESLLPQVMYALPDNLGKINITMGYSLSNSSFYSLFENLLDLQEKARIGNDKIWYYHRHVLHILNHHFISGIIGEIGTALVEKIEDNNMIQISSDFLAQSPLLSNIFHSEEKQDLFAYLMHILVQVRESFESYEEESYFFEKEFSIVFYKLLGRLKDILADKNIVITPSILKRVLKYYSQFEKIPFSGEPLEGLQMMGLMETRNLDFENVIILCANEGQLPGGGALNSFIPYNVRKAFGLPNIDTQDAIYSYLFYRLIQRASNIYLIYNTEVSSNRQSEPSRYLYQLELESGIDIYQHWLSLDIAVTNKTPIIITKSEYILDRLRRYTQDDTHRFSPSSLNTYLYCPLNFYYRYVLDIAEETEVSEDLDASKFGNILHHTLDVLYRPYLNKTITPEIIRNIKKNIDASIKRSFARYYGHERDMEFRYEGKNILGKEIIKDYVIKILEYDRLQTPFEILGLEKKLYHDFPMDLHGIPVKVGLKGIIDRIDRKDGLIRIIDYKSGKDESTFMDIPGLFDRVDDKRNKAIFQTFFYALLYVRNNPECIKMPVLSGLYNVQELYNTDFDLRIKIKNGREKNALDNVLPYLEEFENHLAALILEIYDPEIPFRHRQDKDECMYCESLGMPSDLQR
jgi:hypothetical protein